MKQAIIALLLASSVSAQRAAPQSGKFFYSKFHRDGGVQAGMHWVDTVIADREYPLWLTTQEATLAVFTEDCDRCGEAPKLHFDDVKKDPEPSYDSQDADFYDEHDREMESMRFYGQQFVSVINFTLPEYNRTTSFTTHALGVTQTSHEFSSPFSGYIGIGPYTALNENERHHSFLYQLKKQGMIDHATVALYARQDDDLSIIKFGSYDHEGMRDPHKELRMYKTNNVNTWALRAKYASINSREIFSDGRNFVLDPQNPFIYLPAKDWHRFAINLAIANNAVRCADNFRHYCWIRQPCGEVPDMGLDLRIIVTGGDGGSEHEYFMPQSEFLVPGNFVGESDRECHFAVRKNVDGNTDTVYIGNIFLKSHYVFFDMSPHDEHGEDYIQVGIGPQNPAAIIGETHYNPDFNTTDGTYLPEDATNDMSEQTSGVDPYSNPKYDDAVEKRRTLVDEDNDAYTVQWIKNHKVETIIAASVVLLGLLTCFIICCCYCFKKKVSEREYVGSLMIAFTDENHGIASNTAINMDQSIDVKE